MNPNNESTAEIAAAEDRAEQAITWSRTADTLGSLSMAGIYTTASLTVFDVIRCCVDATKRPSRLAPLAFPVALGFWASGLHFRYAGYDYIHEATFHHDLSRRLTVATLVTTQSKYEKAKRIADNMRARIAHVEANRSFSHDFVKWCAEIWK